MRRPKGVSLGPDTFHPFCSFSHHFRDPFSEHFLMNFGPQNGSQNWPKNGSKIVLFLSSFLGLFFESSQLSRDAPWQSSWPLGVVFGGLRSEKMQTVSREIHFFESLPFGLSEPLLVLLGSSWPLPGPSWGPDGSQKGSKRELKWVQKWVQNWVCFWTAL